VRNLFILSSKFLFTRPTRRAKQAHPTKSQDIRKRYSFYAIIANLKRRIEMKRLNSLIMILCLSLAVASCQSSQSAQPTGGNPVPGASVQVGVYDQKLNLVRMETMTCSDLAKYPWTTNSESGGYQTQLSTGGWLTVQSTAQKTCPNINFSDVTLLQVGVFDKNLAYQRTDYLKCSDLGHYTWTKQPAGGIYQADLSTGEYLTMDVAQVNRVCPKFKP
jgi:hypothetical protein